MNHTLKVEPHFDDDHIVANGKEQETSEIYWEKGFQMKSESTPL